MTTNDFRDPNLQRDALALINEKRRAAELPELPSFGQYLPAPAVDHQAEFRAQLEAGQERLVERRRECGLRANPIEPQTDSTPDQTEPTAKVKTKASKRKKRRKGPPLKPIRVWPKLALAASRANLGGPIRAWTFAKHLDIPGSGVVEHDFLMGFLTLMKVPKSTIHRWIRDAVTVKILIPVRQGSRYLLPSPEEICRIVGATERGQRIEIDPYGLIKPGWKGRLWAGVMMTHTGPISRTTLKELTEVPVRTQQTYDKSGGVQSTANYGLDANSDANQLAAYREYRCAHAFVVHCGDKKRIAFRLPNTYHVPTNIKNAGGTAKSKWSQKRITQRASSVTSEREGRSTFPLGGREGNFPASGRGTDRGEPRQLYFKQPATLQHMIKSRAFKGQTVGMMDFYTWIPGGISRQSQNDGCQWWLVNRERPDIH